MSFIDRYDSSEIIVFHNEEYLISDEIVEFSLIAHLSDYVFMWIKEEKNGHVEFLKLPYDPLFMTKDVDEAADLLRKVSYNGLAKVLIKPSRNTLFNLNSIDLMKFLIDKGFPADSALYTALELDTTRYNWRDSIQEFNNLNLSLKISNESYHNSLGIYFGLRELFTQELAATAMNSFNTRFESLLLTYSSINRNDVELSGNVFNNMKPQYFEMFLALIRVIDMSSVRKAEIVANILDRDSHLDLNDVSRILEVDLRKAPSYAYDFRSFVSSYMPRKFFRNDNSFIDSESLIAAIILSYYDKQWIDSAVKSFRNAVHKYQLNFDDFLVVLDYYQDMEDDSINIEWIVEMSGRDA